MPTAFDMRATAWRKMKEGWLLPLLAGFSLAFLLGSLVDMAISKIGVWNGWITFVQVGDVIPVPEFCAQMGFELSPEWEETLAAVSIPQVTLAYRIVATVANVLWEGILAFGCAVIAIAVMRGGVKAFQVFSGFRWPFRTAALGLLRTLLIALGTLLLIAPGIYAAYSFRMAFFLLADNPEWTPVRALAESRRLMHGHRWRLFCLDVSFFGWFLLVLMTGGLAGIFVIPYHATATAAFYEDLLDRSGR